MIFINYDEHMQSYNPYIYIYIYKIQRLVSNKILIQ